MARPEEWGAAPGRLAATGTINAEPIQPTTSTTTLTAAALLCVCVEPVRAGAGPPLEYCGVADTLLLQNLSGGRCGQTLVDDVVLKVEGVVLGHNCAADCCTIEPPGHAEANDLIVLQIPVRQAGHPRELRAKILTKSADYTTPPAFSRLPGEDFATNLPIQLDQLSVDHPLCPGLRVPDMRSCTRPTGADPDQGVATITVAQLLLTASDALDCSLGKIRRIERGTVRGTRFLTHDRFWLTH